MLILCELCEGGTLIDLLKKNNYKLPEHQILTIMLQIVNGLKFMHSKGYAHRDLKAENVLFS